MEARRFEGDIRGERVCSWGEKWRKLEIGKVVKASRGSRPELYAATRAKMRARARARP